MKDPKKQKIVRQISLIDIIYKPIKNPKISLLYYFIEDISKAYTNFYNQKDTFKRAYSCYECYYCRKFFLKKGRHKRHMENCAGAPVVIYNFNTKNLISFQDNFHAKGDLPFVLYFDFEKQLQQIITSILTEENTCCVLCYDCYLSPYTKIK